MAELKTKANDQSVTEFLARIEDEIKRKDCFTLSELMEQVTGAKPQMWGDSIVDFGSAHYKYESGRENDWFLTGFSPRKKEITLYIMSGFNDYETVLSQLGKYKTGKACLYIRRLADVDLEKLRELVKQSVDHMAKSS